MSSLSIQTALDELLDIVDLLLLQALVLWLGAPVVFKGEGARLHSFLNDRCRCPAEKNRNFLDFWELQWHLGRFFSVEILWRFFGGGRSLLSLLYSKHLVPLKMNTVSAKGIRVLLEVLLMREVWRIKLAGALDWCSYPVALEVSNNPIRNQLLHLIEHFVCNFLLLLRVIEYHWAVLLLLDQCGVVYLEEEASEVGEWNESGVESHSQHLYIRGVLLTHVGICRVFQLFFVAEGAHEPDGMTQDAVGELLLELVDEEALGSPVASGAESGNVFLERVLYGVLHGPGRQWRLLAWVRGLHARINLR